MNVAHPTTIQRTRPAGAPVWISGRDLSRLRLYGAARIDRVNGVDERVQATLRRPPRLGDHLPVVSSRTTGPHFPGTVARMALAVRYQSKGYTLVQIGKKLGVKKDQVKQYLAWARRGVDGAQLIADAALYVDRYAVPTAVDNLMTALEEGQVWATRDTLKGRGILAPKSAPQATAPHALQINIVGVGSATPAPFEVLGVPRAAKTLPPSSSERS